MNAISLILSYAIIAGLAVFFLLVCFMGIAIMTSYRFFKKPWVKIGLFFAIFLYGVIILTDHHATAKSAKSTERKPSSEGVVSVVSQSYWTHPAVAIGRINDVWARIGVSRGSSEAGLLSVKPYSERQTFFLELFYLLGVMYVVVLATLSFFVSKTMNQFRGWLCWWRERCLFFGADEPARLLARNILTGQKRGSKNACWFYLDISQQNNRELFEELDGMGAVVVYRKLDAPDFCGSCLGKKAARWFFIGDDEELNVRMATSTINALKDDRKRKAERIHLYIRTETSGHLFDQDPNKDKTKDANSSLPDNVELHVFSQSDLTARHFVKDHPMHKCPGGSVANTIDVKNDFRLLLLGFGQTGREMLNKCICDAQFKDCTFSATVIDHNVNKKYSYYPVLFDECIKEYNLGFYPLGGYPKAEDGALVCDVNSPTFYKWVCERLASFNRIIVTLGDDKTNVETAKILARLLIAEGKTVKECRELIFVHVRHHQKYAYYENHGKIPFTVFGNIERIYTQGDIIKETEDRIAKMVHYVYALDEKKALPQKADVDYKERMDVLFDDWEDVEKQWKALPLFLKDSNRAVAQSLKNLCSVIRDKGEDIYTLKAVERAKALVQERLELLAENEHLRWNAFHFTKGVRCLPKDKLKAIVDDKDEKPIDVPHKVKDSNGYLIKHACLVKFSELKEVSRCVNALLEKHNPPGKQFKKKEFETMDHLIIQHFPVFIREIAKPKKASKI